MARTYDSQKRVLVTGGAGFLGSHLMAGRPRFEFLRHDVTFPLFVEVDEIYDLACPASRIHYHYDPVQTTKTSVHGAMAKAVLGWDPLLPLDQGLPPTIHYFAGACVN